MLPIAILLLAAGGSRRLGQPKQLLPYGDTGATLLRHAAETAVAANLGPVIVILGAAEEPCRETLQHLPVTLVTHTAWPDGMGSSIAVGMRVIVESAHRAVIIMLCDQPAITSETLLRLDERQQATGTPMVASRYNGVLGAPALFTSNLFPELRLLRGDRGARSLLQREADTAFVDCPEARFDIDTEDDLVCMPAMH